MSNGPGRLSEHADAVQCGVEVGKRDFMGTPPAS